MIQQETVLFQELLDSQSIHFDSRLDMEVAKLLRESGLQLAVVESITGGMLSQRLTALAGSSVYFLGGLVTYHTKLKIKLAGVSPVTVREKTVVSEEVALEMVQGLKRMTQADICISTTGVAGPENEVFSSEMTGRIYIGFMIEKFEKVKQFYFSGNREMIRQQTVSAALAYLRQYLVNRKGGEIYG